MMSKSFSVLLAGAAIAALSPPATAQDEPYHHVEMERHVGAHDGEWQGQRQGGDTWRGMWDGRFTTREG